MASTEVTDSPQVKFARSFLHAIATRNVDDITSHLHKDFRCVTFPQSVGIPEETREQWLQSFGKVMGLWSEDSSHDFHSITDAPGKVIVHFTGKAMTKVGVLACSEMILILHLVTDADGSLKMNCLEKFADSKDHLDFVKAVQEAKAKK